MRDNPEVAFRDCGHCRKWLYDEKTGQVLTRHGKDVPRGDVPTPCDSSTGCPKGHYNDQKTLSDRNKMAYTYYKEGNAVNWVGVPIDGVVRRNSALIEDVESNADKAENYRLLGQIGGLAALARGAAGGRK